MHTVIDRTRTDKDGSTAQSAADRVRRKSEGGGGLYKPRAPIYPKLAHGQWRAIKWALLALTLGVYYITPWIRWDRPGHAPDQAVLVDFTGRRFYFFDIQLWPQEVYFITGLLVMGALALFLVTALFGRLWCGYACPQTIWTDLFIAVERLFEGDRNARMRLDAAPMSLNKLWRKTGKHLVWMGIAFGTGGAWIFYFHDAPTLIRDFWVGKGPMTAYVSCFGLTLSTYVFAGWMREQVCVYMCPWPRIQGAMLDQHSLQVTYRRDRGEPRGAHKKGQDWAGRGDCVDCGQCVAVCPMGIDIRDGSQLECINCGLCIDACDEILTKLDRPTGLIAYDTDAAVAARACHEKPVYPLLRSRTIYYSAALTIVSGLTLWGLFHRDPVELHVIRDRNPTFVRMHDGAIRDGYTLKIANRGFEDRRFVIGLDGLAKAKVWRPGEVGDDLSILVPADEVVQMRVFVSAPSTSINASSMPVRFTIAAGEVKTEAKSVFLSGAANPQ